MIQIAWTTGQVILEDLDNEEEAENPEDEESVRLSLPAIHLAYHNIMHRLNDFTTIARLLPSCTETVLKFIQEPQDHTLNTDKEMVLIPHFK